jgi:hypothetical protein
MRSTVTGDAYPRPAMTRAHRLVLGAVGGLIALAFVAWAVVAAAGGAGGRDQIEQLTAGAGAARAASGDADGAAGTTVTTFALVPVTGGAPLPTTTAKPPPKPPPPPPESAVTSTTAGGPPPPPAIGADGAVLVATEGADAERARPVDKAKGCYSAVDPGWRVVDCGALKRADVTLLWLTEQHPKTRGLRALVLRERSAGQWAVVLHARDDDAKRFSSIGVRGADVSGDGQPDLVFGFHHRAPGKAVGVDVVEGPGVVTLHRDLPGPSTSVHASAGQLHTWASQTDGTALHQTIKVMAGAWRVAASQPVPRSSVPPSMV